MTVNKRSSFKLPHPGPYIARITNAADPTYSGIVEAVIEQGTANNPKFKDQTVPLRYMSPFFGVTPAADGKDNTKWDHVRQSYGFWMVPPDIGTRVICMFIESDSNQGYWFGCIPEPFQNHMVPGIAASVDIAGGSGYLPVAEYLTTDAKSGTNPHLAKKPIHPFAQRLSKQGLIKDTIRGVTSSSARREVPSRVFGISTPGAVDPKSRKVNVGYAGTDGKTFSLPGSRVGGHTFVMDDGDMGGQNQLVRLRTTGGHQILMHDSANLIYIGNSDGTSWIEMTANGKIDIYAQDSVSIHTEADFNFRADRDVNIEAVRNVNIKSGVGTNIESVKDFNLRVGGKGQIYIEDTFQQFTRGSYISTTADNFELYAINKFNLTSTNGGISMMAYGGDYKVNANTIHHNGSKGTDASVAKEALSLTTRLPANSFPGGVGSTITRRVPVHEPWSQHENVNPALFASNNTDASGRPTAVIPSSTGTGTVETLPPCPPEELVVNPNVVPKWTEDTEFIDKVKALASQLNADYLDLLAIMMLETAGTMSPSKRNPLPGTSATGLIQFLEASAKGVGTTTAQLAQMTRGQQMEYVSRYFKNQSFPVKPVSINDLYMAVFAPIAVGKGDSYAMYLAKNDTFYPNGKPKLAPYYLNRQYDTSGDGTITKAEACARLLSFKAKVKQQLGIK